MPTEEGGRPVLRAGTKAPQGCEGYGEALTSTSSLTPALRARSRRLTVPSLPVAL